MPVRRRRDAQSDGATDRLSLQGPYARLGISVFCTMNVIMLTMGALGLRENPDTRFAAALADFLRYFAMLFTIPVLVLLGRPWPSRRRASCGEDCSRPTCSS